MKEQLASFDNAGINYSETLQPASTKKRFQYLLLSD